MDSVAETSDPAADINNPLDKLLYGAVIIGRVAGLIENDPPTRPELRKTYHALESGYLDADKFGGSWVSTPRRLKRAATFKQDWQPREPSKPNSAA